MGVWKKQLWLQNNEKQKNYKKKDRSRSKGSRSSVRIENIKGSLESSKDKKNMKRGIRIPRIEFDWAGKGGTKYKPILKNESLVWLAFFI